MSERQSVEVRIAPDGTVTAETHGVVGEACLDFITVLEDLLDATTTSSEYTADFTRTHVQENNPNVIRDQ